MGGLFYVMGCSGWDMMQKVLTKYWLAIHVGLVLFFPWLYLTQPSVVGLVPLLWLSLIAIETAVLLPNVRRGETLADARVRVAHAVLWDPFLYLGLSLMVVMAAQWLNGGCSLVYLEDANLWQFSDPPVKWLPFSVEPRAPLTVLAVFTACVTGAVILRQSVSTAGKRYLLQAAAGVSGCIAFYMVWRACGGSAPYAVIAKTPFACGPGSVFGFWLVLGMGVYADALERQQKGTELFFALAFLGNLLGMLFFASAAALMVYAAVALLLVIYWMIYLNFSVPKPVQLKLFLVTLVIIVSVTLSLVFVFPDNPVVDKVKSVLAWEPFWSALSATKEVRSSAALELWKEHPWAGVGADGFRHYVGMVIEDKSWAVLKADQAYVYNDCLQFLCEFGTLGSGLLVAAVITLMVPICYRLRLAWLRQSEDDKAGRVFILRLSPLVFTGVLATTLIFLESWIANPFHSHPVLLSWVFAMAILPSFLPAKKG